MNAAPAVRRLTRLAIRVETAPDADLLGRYVTGRDADAFAVLVERHGAMVLGVCRRVTGDLHAAEDAYQATFLALARRAATIRSPEALPAWLFGTARRVALRARDRLGRQRTAPPADAPAPGPDPLDRLSAREFLGILDDELARLPAKYRSAVVLCSLEGTTVEAAARHLGSTAGAVRGWLQRGRERLRRRLERRGLALSALVALGAGARPSSALATVASGFARSVEGVPGSVLALTAASPPTLRIAGLVLLAASLAGVGFALLPAHGAPQEQPPQEKEPRSPAGLEPKPGPNQDQFGDPLPAGAIARLGTMRMRHGGSSFALAFSPDGREVATGGVDGALHVWDAATGRERLRITELREDTAWTSPVVAVAYSPDGRHLAVANMNGPTVLWDVRTGKKIRMIGDESVRPSRLQFSPDGKHLTYDDGGGQLGRVASVHVASVESGKGVAVFPSGRIWFPATKDRFIHHPASDGPAVLYRLPDGAELRRFDGHTGATTASAVSGDGRRLFTCGEDRTIRGWDADSGKEVVRLDGAGDGGPRIVPDREGKRVLTIGQRASRLTLWDTSTGKELWTAKLDAEWEGVTMAAFLPTGEIVTGHQYGKIRAWDPTTGRETRAVRPQRAGQVWMAVSPDGTRIATSVNDPLDSAVVLTDTATFKPALPDRGHQAQIRHAVFRPDGRLVATGAWDGTTRLWEPRTGKFVRTIHGLGVGSFTFTPDGRALFAAGWSDGKVRSYDPESGKVLREWASGSSGLSALVMTADGRTVVTAGDKVRSWNARTGTMAREFAVKTRPWLIALSSDDRTLAVAEYQGAIALWDVPTGRQAYELTPAAGIVGALAFSPDGALLAWCDSDQGVRVTETATGRLVRTLPGPVGSQDTLAFSPDGKSLAWATANLSHREVRIWEVRTGQLRRQLFGRQSGALAYSPDGSLLVTGGLDGAALVWDVHGRGEPRRAATPAQLAAWWDELSQEDAAKAYAAMVNLRAAGPAAVVAVREKVSPVERADAKQLAAWAADLDSDAFRVRERASRELERLGESAAGALRQVETGGKTEEAKTRARRLLEAVETGRLRHVRAVEVLDMIGDADAVKVLAELAGGAPDAPLTRDAGGAVKRLGR